MSLDIEAALRDGYQRTRERNGLLLVGAFVVIVGVMTVLQDSFASAIDERIDYGALFAGVDPTAIEEFRATITESLLYDYVDASPGLLLAAILAVYLVRLVVKVGAIRTLVSDETTRLPSAQFTRRLGWAVVNLVVGAIVYVLVVGVGLVLFVLPGIYLAVALFFYNYEILVADENVVDAFKGSWELTRGERVNLFLLGLVVAVIATILGFLGGVAGVVGSLPQFAVQTLLTAAVAVFGIAVAARAYTQLTAEPDPATEENVGALGPDDLA
jgi:hypothetical protein